MAEKLVKLMTEEYMEEHLDELNWKEVCLYQKLSVDFITRHLKQIDFPSLSVNPYITFEILDKFSNKISWSSISLNGKALTKAVMYNYRNKLIWTLVLSHQQLDLEFLIHMSETMRKSRSKNAKEFWKAVSRYQDIDNTYIKYYRRYIDFKELSANIRISEDVIDKFFDVLDPQIIVKHRDLSKDLLTKYRKEFDAAIKKNMASNK